MALCHNGEKKIRIEQPPLRQQEWLYIDFLLPDCSDRIQSHPKIIVSSSKHPGKGVFLCPGIIAILKNKGMVLCLAEKNIQSYLMAMARSNI